MEVMTDINFIPRKEARIKRADENLQQAVQLAFKELLEERHLYQRHSISHEPFEVLAEALTWQQSGMTSAQLEEHSAYADSIADQFSKAHWAIVEPRILTQRSRMKQDLSLPAMVWPTTILLACDLCNHEKSPHNLYTESELQERKGAKGSVQVFDLAFECQACKAEPLRFMIRREGLSLWIVGRSRFEQVATPDFIPAEERNFYSKAVIAFQTGNILAAHLYLRVLIERYMRRMTGVTGKKTGDQLWDEYSPLLDDDFAPRFRTLKTVYEELSFRIHDADESDDSNSQFEKSLKQVGDHFRQLELIPLKKH